MMAVHRCELSDLQRIVYEWVKLNPWHKRMQASEAVVKKYGFSWRQVLNAHIAITRKGLLQKSESSMNTVYAVRTLRKKQDTQELERKRFISWLENEHGFHDSDLVWWPEGKCFIVFIVQLSWSAWLARAGKNTSRRESGC
ncbi:hypothetical protein AZ91_08020 [Salmonella enterica subsp. enterica serovar Typhimurium]|uniref:hypothetical protein n=1 Tax=Enterobacteriaceae TaxID=543 RepID=UPI000FDA684B|nr:MULTISPECIES: hypothetical protein [Enterobacteriaceae]EBD1155406.1 hypothetical protein [Salmonella enterica subsp. enterica serovar Uganda]EBI0198270.1 hypothetical protein [Salmonella enterica subsp. enterica serovar Liverpool]EDW7034226.1 hypothetical protein [Salmonella enterica subsp. enterica serovar 4,[5],12:i:-]EEJ2831180.1 hypothetical protein [Salmonella enterica subsp. enterica serovar London]EGD1344162.1 hypothetical protein [Salmonella enterica subsp. enterica serovar Senftenb